MNLKEKQLISHFLKSPAGPDSDDLSQISSSVWSVMRKHASQCWLWPSDTRNNLCIMKFTWAPADSAWPPVTVHSSTWNKPAGRVWSGTLSTQRPDPPLHLGLERSAHTRRATVRSQIFNMEGKPQQIRHVGSGEDQIFVDAAWIWSEQKILRHSSPQRVAAVCSVTWSVSLLQQITTT